LKLWFLIGGLIGVMCEDLVSALIGLALALFLFEVVLEQLVVLYPTLEFLAPYRLGMHYLEIGFALAAFFVQIVKHTPIYDNFSKNAWRWPVFAVVALICFVFVPLPGYLKMSESPLTGAFVLPPPSFPGRFLFGEGVDIRHGFVSDDFSTDSALNTRFWSAGTPLLNSIAAHLGSKPVGLGIAHTRGGMVLSGVTGNYEFTGIQSRARFSTPLTLETAVYATRANGNPFEIYLVTEDLSQYLMISGNLNGNNGGCYGIWLRSTARGAPLGEQEPQILYEQPQQSIWYILRLSINSNGFANIILFDYDRIRLASKQNIQVGKGPFYVVLGQREGLPYTNGANEAVWSWLRLTTDQLSPDQESGSIDNGSASGTVASQESPICNAGGYAANAGTLRLFPPEINKATREIVVNGVDSAQPTTPFRFIWGDGTLTVGWFPQRKIYKKRPFTIQTNCYQVWVVANHADGSTTEAAIAVSP